MRKVIDTCPEYLYTYTPEPGDVRYVFTDGTYRTLPTAYKHSILLRVAKEVSHD